MAQDVSSAAADPRYTTPQLGEKIKRLRALADPNMFTAEEWRVVTDQTNLVNAMFEGMLPDQERTLEKLRPIMSNICKGTRSVTERQLRIIAAKFKLPSPSEIDIEPWEWLLDTMTTEELTGELMRVGYGLFGRPNGNPFLHPDGPLAWLAPYRMVMGGLAIHRAVASLARFDEEEFEPVATLAPRSPLQITLDLSVPRYTILLAVYPRMPDRRALCLVPSPRVPNHRLVAAATLPTVARKGERVFRAPALAGTYLLLAILSARDFAVGWLPRARAALYTPSITDLAALERELARHDPDSIEVRYLAFAVAS